MSAPDPTLACEACHHGPHRLRRCRVRHCCCQSYWSVRDAEATRARWRKEAEQIGPVSAEEARGVGSAQLDAEAAQQRRLRRGERW